MVHKATKIDYSGPIDFGLVKGEIQANGPLRVSREGNPFQLLIDIAPCMCGKADCTTDVVSVHRTVGLSQISWTLTSEELTEHSSLEEFFAAAQIFGPTSSSGERRIVERHIRDFLGKEYHEIDHPFCACAACAETIGDIELWKRHLLSSLAISFDQLDKMRSVLEDEDQTVFMQDFDAGYSLGRLVGEYFLKARVEEDAKRGIAAKEAIKARTEASGQSSSSKRHQRIEAMLEKMEVLLTSNPALHRLGLDQIADLAIQDATEQDPVLWSQGQGQKRLYLDELRSDLRYRTRFEELTKTA